MSGQLWVIRAGQQGRYLAEFEDRSIIAVGFEAIATDDLSGVPESVIRGRASDPAERVAAGQLATFVCRMEVGDLVLVSRVSTKRDYLVGRITSGYRYVTPAPAYGPHQRSIEWLGTVPRDEMSKAATNTLGAILTLFRPTAVEPELRSLITRLRPVGGAGSVTPPPPTSSQADGVVTPKEAEPSSRTQPPSDPTPPQVGVPGLPLRRLTIDVRLDEHGRAHIDCKHPALVMEQTPRHIDPADDWSGVPGIYVLTGTDLISEAVRTGTERTLTTTLIVRPWAYVGLSEDFLGRLGSHRQSKPEWRRALLVRSGSGKFSSDDIKYLELRVYDALKASDEVEFNQSVPRGNISAAPRETEYLDSCASAVVSVLRLTGTLI